MNCTITTVSSRQPTQMLSQYLWTGRLSWWCLFTTRGIELYSNYRRITLLFLLGKVSSRGQERRMWLILQPQIQEDQCGFCPSCGTLDQLHTFHRVLKGPWEFAQPVHMCFVELKKAFNRVPHGIMWEVLLEYRAQGPLLGAVRYLYEWSSELGWHCWQ